MLPAVLCVIAASAATASAQGRVTTRLGEANVGGQRVLVHVTVAVPPGADENAVADEALRGQGARPLQSAEFAVNGLKWDQFSTADTGDDVVLQNYNAANEAVDSFTSFVASQELWSDVSTSKFAFDENVGATERCPSLVKECPGDQIFDGHNDVGWLAISGCCTLAVTWYSTTIDEADMAMNTRFQWSTVAGGSGYDVQTVMTHENGHVLGLGHSTVPGSIMQATYSARQLSLSPDDERAVTYLYPESWAISTISGVVKSGKTGNPVAGVKVSMVEIPASATTNSSGAFTLSGIPLGTYTVTLSANGYKTTTATVKSEAGGSSTELLLQPKGR
jgi:hypothetical protein